MKTSLKYKIIFYGEFSNLFYFVSSIRYNRSSKNCEKARKGSKSFVS